MKISSTFAAILLLLSVMLGGALGIMFGIEHERERSISHHEIEWCAITTQQIAYTGGVNSTGQVTVVFNRVNNELEEPKIVGCDQDHYSQIK